MENNFIPVLKQNIEITELSNNTYLLSNDDFLPKKISHLGKLIIDLIDNERSINEIILKIRHTHEEIRIEQLKQFVLHLIENELLENAEPRNKSKKSIWKKISFIKIVSFNSDKFYKYITVLFDGKLLRITIVISLIVILFAVFYFIFTGFKYIPSITDFNLFKGSFYWYYPFLMVFMFIRIFLHESSHAIMCRYYNQKVRNIGIALYLLHPVFYTDTTNMWKEKNKYKRIIVSLAGPFCDISFLSFLYIINTFFVENVIYYNAITIIIIISFLRSLFNFNPFIKLDGYYIIMDLLEIPNLRKKSLAYLKDIVFFKKHKHEIKAKNKVGFLFFGVLSSIATVMVILSLIIFVYYNIFNISH